MKRVKMIEHPGYGETQIRKNESFKNVLVYVENEPDSILAVSLIVKNENKNFDIFFTDRQSINFDITSILNLKNNVDEILIVGSSIDKYSVKFLNSLNIKYLYIGNTTKLKDFDLMQNKNEQIFPNGKVIIEKNSLSERIALFYGIALNNVEDYPEIKYVLYYTEKLYPKNINFFDILKYQYLHFILKPVEYFEYFMYHKIEDNKLEIAKKMFENDYNNSMKKIQNIKVISLNGNKIGFVEGGCPCNLILNLAIQKYDLDTCINVCIQRQHFTILNKKENNMDIFKHLDNYIYSGYGKYSGGASFGPDYTIDELIESFRKDISISGFYKFRLLSYDEFNFNDHKWIPFINNTKLYQNFNFTIFLDTICNANCKFCIEQIKTVNNGKINKVGVLEDKKLYLKKLEEVLSKIRKYNPSISITGGEPLISPVIKEVLLLIKKYKFRKVVITTNGTNINNVVNEIIDANISHINFSRPHFNDEITQKIMRFKDDDMIKFKEFDNIVNILEKNNVETRFNCILSKEGIHTLNQMKEYMENVYLIGCKNVVFREMMSFNEETALNLEKKDYARQNRIFINDIWNEIDKDTDFIPYSNILGHYYYIEIYKYKEKLKMVTERANIQCLEDKRKFNLNYVYEMVFHPNGLLCAGWDETRDLIEIDKL